VVLPTLPAVQHRHDTLSFQGNQQRRERRIRAGDHIQQPGWDLFTGLRPIGHGQSDRRIAFRAFDDSGERRPADLDPGVYTGM